MKNLLPLLALVLMITACSNNKGFEINGTVENMTEGMVILQKVVDNNLVAVDTTDLINGSFTFTGSVDYPEMYVLKIADMKMPVQVFLENSKISMNINPEDPESMVVTGSESNDNYKAFMDGVSEYRQQINELTQQYREASMNGTLTEDMNAEMSAKANELYAQQDIFIKESAFKNASNVIGPWLTSQTMHLFEVNELDSLNSLFNSDFNETPYAKTVADKLVLLKKTAIGQPFIDFTLNTPEDKPLAVSDIKAKLLLIDFWASWCSPCRKENPNVVKLYADYKEKGLEILGVSFDRSKDAWLKAIKDDGIKWLQVSDLKYWQCEAGKLYGIQSIPSTILVDENGIIIAKNLRGQELEEKVAEILD